ncbi:MAG: hypothetical protein RLZZ383_1127 [Pseudomonadota bacterium]
MSERCPFCHKPVAEAVVQYGGTCPSCFADIPGEDVATDPGEIVRAQRRAKDEADVRKQSMKQAWMFAPVALAVLGFGVVALMPEPEITELVIEDFAIDFDMKEWDPKAGTKAQAAAKIAKAEDAAKAGPTDPADPADPAAKATAAASAGSVAASAADGAALKGASAGASPVAGAATPSLGTPASGMAAPSVAASTGGAGMGLGGMPEVTAERSGPMLSASKKDEIVAVVRSLMSRRKADIGECITPGLSGSWMLKITFNEKGEVKAVDLAPQGAAVPEFETCVEGNVKFWKLGAQLDRELTVPVPLNLKG